MTQRPLFDAAEPNDTAARPRPSDPAEAGRGRPRYQRAVRDQIAFQAFALDELLPDDHQARAVWAFAESCDLTPLYDRIKAIEGHVGRDPIDPRILVALWLYATIDGVGSARRLARLCERDVVYRWLRGGVSVNYHTLSDSRVQHGDVLDQLLTESVATLMHQGLVHLNRVAQDGMRVRAGAGTSSFHGRATLERYLEEAKTQIETLRQELEADPGKGTRRERSARRRAAQERQDLVARALAEMKELEAQREARQKGSGEKAKTSTTDPEARVMKMADNGFRPAYNVEFATDVDSQVIVGTAVINVGGDGGQMEPMVQQIEERYNEAPKEYVVDGGFSTLDDIEAVGGAPRNTTVYAPVKEEEKKRKRGIDPFAPLPGDSATVAAWRQRMGTKLAKEMAKLRASTAECVNAQARNRGLLRFRVRGLIKVRAVALWHALAHNVMRAVALRATKPEKALALA
jgi:transposase